MWGSGQEEQAGKPEKSQMVTLLASQAEGVGLGPGDNRQPKHRGILCF